jgi:hypothetical protein
MGISKEAVGWAIAAACFLPGNASAFGGILLLDRDHVHVSTVSSHTAYNFPAAIAMVRGHRASTAPDKSIEADLPCPNGHNWQAADSTPEPIRQKSAKPNLTPTASDKTASTSKTSKKGTDQSIIFVGGRKAPTGTKAQTPAAKAGTGELRHNQSTIRTEEKK